MLLSGFTTRWSAGQETHAVPDRCEARRAEGRGGVGTRHNHNHTTRTERRYRSSVAVTPIIKLRYYIAYYVVFNVVRNVVLVRSVLSVDGRPVITSLRLTNIIGS